MAFDIRRQNSESVWGVVSDRILGPLVWPWIGLVELGSGGYYVLLIRCSSLAGLADSRCKTCDWIPGRSNLIIFQARILGRARHSVPDQTLLPMNFSNSNSK
jgi:hypothetical protein